MSEVAGDMVQEKLLFRLHCSWLRSRLINGLIRGPHDCRSVPWNCEEYSPIRCLWDHQRGISRQEGPRQHEMGALADNKERAGPAMIHIQCVLNLDTTGVNHHFRLQIKDAVFFPVSCLDADRLATALQQTNGFHVV